MHSVIIDVNSPNYGFVWSDVCDDGIRSVSEAESGLVIRNIRRVPRNHDRKTDVQ